MTEASDLLAQVKTVLLIDWPSRDVPDALALGGFTVFSEEDKPRLYEADSEKVVAREVERLPDHADLVYAHRPIDELPDIVSTARSLGAKAVWLQSGRDETGAKDPRACWFSPDDSRRAREIVEGASLDYIEAPYIADAVRARK